MPHFGKNLNDSNLSQIKYQIYQSGISPGHNLMLKEWVFLDTKLLNPPIFNNYERKC